MRFLTACILLMIAYTVHAQRLGYHDIKTDAARKIIPWYNASPAISYDHVLRLTWKFWDTMRTDYNGLPYYMNHQVWRPVYNDARGLGGDQFQMALSSWQLLYAYTGDQRVKENMRFMADYYLSHGLSPANCAWPGIPFPYNDMIYSGNYDGDMILGKNYTQPDKAGSLGIELVKLYKLVSREQYPNLSWKNYLDAAVQIANTLVKHVGEGDYDHSPLPFKVNVLTGETGLSTYTTNWSGTLELLLVLQQLKTGDTEKYKQAFDTILAWMKKFPMQNNRWGPFFEDIPGWSDTQINAITWAQFIMNHRAFFPEWKNDVQKIFDWVYSVLGNKEWEKYGVTAVNEQTAYKVPGNSHTSRQASAEIQFMYLTGNWSRLDNAVRQLNWATYMVDKDGKNRYPRDQVWLTDGYGDYVRHYLRAMAYAPELAPLQDHILSSTSIIQLAEYGPVAGEFYTYELRKADPTKIRLIYKTFDDDGIEKVKLTKKPVQVLFEGKAAREVVDENEEGYMWKNGVVTIIRKKCHEVIII